jgi:hypothetical protein
VHQQNFPVFLQPLPYYQLTQLIEVDESAPWTHLVAFFQDAPRRLEVDELLAGPLPHRLIGVGARQRLLRLGLDFLLRRVPPAPPSFISCVFLRLPWALLRRLFR